MKKVCCFNVTHSDYIWGLIQRLTVWTISFKWRVNERGRRRVAVKSRPWRRHTFSTRNPSRRHISTKLSTYPMYFWHDTCMWWRSLESQAWLAEIVKGRVEMIDWLVSTERRKIWDDKVYRVITLVNANSFIYTFSSCDSAKNLHLSTIICVQAGSWWSVKKWKTPQTNVSLNQQQ